MSCPNSAVPNSQTAFTEPETTAKFVRRCQGVANTHISFKAGRGAQRVLASTTQRSDLESHFGEPHELQ